MPVLQYIDKKPYCLGYFASMQIAIHCKWDDWVNGTCSVTCGVGTREDTRVKLVEEANGGTCTGKPTEIVQCNEKECLVDGKYCSSSHQSQM